jgi:altronate hydrolase
MKIVPINLAGRTTRRRCKPKPISDMLPFLQINPQDNVLVALADLQKGSVLQFRSQEITLQQDCPAKHKFLISPLKKDEALIMYGVTVGRVLEDLPVGGVITTANTRHDASPYVVRESHYSWTPPDVSAWKDRTFMGYPRSDGQVGTRNFWLVVPLVFCENRNVEYIRNAFLKKLGYAVPDAYEELVGQLVDSYRDHKLGDYQPAGPSESKNASRLFPNVDGIKFLNHEGGCGGTREDTNTLGDLIAGYLNNPNVAGATILSLGCQHIQISILQDQIRMKNPSFDKPVLYFEQQKYPGGEPQLLTDAIVATFRELARANEAVRVSAPLSKLSVGLKCGGSDGFSGITANPAMGHLSDILTTLGARTILAEFPELCGVEQELIDRCVDTTKAAKFATLMRGYQERAEAIGSGFDMNPSPGNIRDGLITDAIKSAGAAKKGGTAPVSGVLDYAEYPRDKGLHLLCTPGNDVEATTGMAGSGATLIIFSTGLGTPTGNPVAPVVKTATNSLLAKRMADIIDFDHGDIITSGKSIDQSAEDLLEELIRIASGEKITAAERLQQDDFIPWKRGVSL